MSRSEAIRRAVGRFPVDFHPRVELVKYVSSRQLRAVAPGFEDAAGRHWPTDDRPMATAIVWFNMPDPHCWFEEWGGPMMPPGEAVWAAPSGDVEQFAVVIAFDGITGEEWLAPIASAPSQAFIDPDVIRRLVEPRVVEVRGTAPVWTSPSGPPWTATPTATPFSTPVGVGVSRALFGPPAVAEFAVAVGDTWTYRVAVQAAYQFQEWWAGQVIVRVSDIRRVGPDTLAVAIDREATGSGNDVLIPDVLGDGPADSPAWLLVHQRDLYEPSRFADTLSRLLAGDVPPAPGTRTPRPVPTATPRWSPTPTAHTPIDYPPPGQPWPTPTPTHVLPPTATPDWFGVSDWPALPHTLEPGLVWGPYEGHPTSWVALGRGRVWTPAGSFEGCWLLKQTKGAGFLRDRWFCPGIGLVREDACGNMGWFSLVIELLEYQVAH